MQPVILFNGRDLALIGVFLLIIGMAICGITIDRIRRRWHRTRWLIRNRLRRDTGAKE